MKTKGPNKQYTACVVSTMDIPIGGLTGFSLGNSLKSILFPDLLPNPLDSGRLSARGIQIIQLAVYSIIPACGIFREIREYAATWKWELQANCEFRAIVRYCDYPNDYPPTSRPHLPAGHFSVGHWVFTGRKQPHSAQWSSSRNSHPEQCCSRSARTARDTRRFGLPKRIHHPDHQKRGDCCLTSPWRKLL